MTMRSDSDKKRESYRSIDPRTKDLPPNARALLAYLQRHEETHDLPPVSYTHLDVYKRQLLTGFWLDPAAMVQRHREPASEPEAGPPVNGHLPRWPVIVSGSDSSLTWSINRYRFARADVALTAVTEATSAKERAL